MKRKIGIVSSCIKDKSEIDTIRQIKDYGFDCFFSSEKQFDIEYVAALKNEAIKVGLEYEFIHGPFANINDMWSSEEEPKIFRDLKTAIDAAKESGVKSVVAHVSSSFYPPQINSLGLSLLLYIFLGPSTLKN